MMRTAALRFGGLVSTGTLGGMAFIGLSDDQMAIDARRAVKIYGHFAPLVMEYRMLEAEEKHIGGVSDERWQALHEKYAPRVLSLATEMQGFVIKYCQVLAGRPDLLPDVYIDRLKLLEDAVPPMEKDKVWGILREGFKTENGDGREPSEIFSEWDDRPIGSASIGQVHRARLRKSGDVVAVKVMYPDAEKLFRSDIRSTRQFVTLFAPEQKVMFDEIEKQFATEFDYRKEAENLCKIRDNVLKGGFGREIVVPRPVWEYTTKTVLCMDFIEGEKLSTVIRRFAEKHAVSQGKTLKELEREMLKSYLEKGPPGPYHGPSASSIAAYSLALRGLDWCANIPRHCINNIFLWPFGLKEWALPLRHTELPPNTARIMDVLMRAMAHQVLADKCFHGDIHGGNLLLLKDGRLGLIDMGQVKTLSEDEAENLCRTYLLLKAGDKRGLKESAIRRGYQSKYLDENVIYNMTRFALDSDGPEVIGKDQNIQQFIDDQFKRDPWIQTDDSIIMPCRVAMMLRGIGLQLGHPVSVADWMAPAAKKELEKIREKRKAEKTHDLPLP
eukprot:330219_1